MTKFSTRTSAPNGAGAKLTRKLTEALLKSFNESGSAAITKLIEENPSAYLRLIAALPTSVDPSNPIEGLMEDELDHALTYFRHACRTPDGADGGEGNPPKDK